MSAYAAVSCFRCNLLAGVVALIFPLWVLALDNAPPEALSVKVFPDRYVAAGKPFSDLAALEAWAKPIRIRVLWLDSCGPASVKPLLAAVERFHSVYVEGIQIRTFAVGQQECVGTVDSANLISDGVTRLPVGNEYRATDQSGRSTMP
jgi:hypothetical protein